MSEENLWAAVINQAIKDATATPSCNFTELEIQRARDWLTKPNAQFDYVCELAGRNPVRTRNSATAIIAKSAGFNTGNDAKAMKHARARRSRQELAAIIFNGKSQSLSKWSKELGLDYGTLFARLRKGWTVEAAFSKPPSGTTRYRQKQFVARPGGGSDFENVMGTGGGSTAQDLPETEFFQKDTSP